MRLVLALAVALSVPLAGCLHSVVAAGVDDATLESEGWNLREGRTHEELGGAAKAEIRGYDRGELTQGFALVTVITVPNIPGVTSRVVDQLAEQALAEANAVEDGTVDVAATGAGAGTVTGTKFTVEQEGQEGKGYRAEFECDSGYVVVIGVGADLPLPNATGTTMFDAAVDLADKITCEGGDGQSKGTTTSGETG